MHMLNLTFSQTFHVGLKVGFLHSKSSYKFFPLLEKQLKTLLQT